MDRDKTALWVTLHEGKRYSVYMDTVGLLTVGIGFNLQRVGGRQRIEALKLNYEEVCNGECVLRDDHINKLFDDDLGEAIENAMDAIDSFSLLPDDVQMAVVDMIFNLGFGGFRKFKNMIAALEQQDYCAAAAAMRDSKWAQQVPNRAKADIQLIEQFCVTPGVI